MPDGDGADGTSADPPSSTDATSGSTTSATPPDGEKPDGDGGTDDRRRDADPVELRNALQSERERRKSYEAEARRLQALVDQQADAGKSEAERAATRAERAEARVRELEAEIGSRDRDALRRQIADESGIPTLWARLQGDDARSLRADANRLRDELGVGKGALDGGVRGMGGAPQPTSMDELIRAGARRR